MANAKLKSKIFDVADTFDWLEMAYARGWTDGLPVLPPTEEKVAEMVECMGKDPQELVGVLAPKQGKPPSRR